MIRFLTKLLKKENRQYLLALVTLGVGIYIGTFFASTKVENTTTTVEVVKHDTVEVYKNRDVIKYVTVKVKEPYEVIVYKENPEFSTRLYKADTAMEEGLTVGYDAIVKGYLLDIKLTYEDTRPEIIKYITKEVVVEKTISRVNRGVYIGGTISVPNKFSLDNADIAPTVDVLLNKNIFSYGYQVFNGVHQIGYKRRIF